MPLLRVSATPGSAIRRSAVAAAATMTLLASAQAQTSHEPRDRRSQLGGPPLAAQPPPATFARDGEHRERAEVAAARLLLSARRDLAEGRREVAQRVLEVLVARYPESEAAAEGRRQLLMLYADDQRIGGMTAPQRQAAQASVPQPAPTAAPPPAAQAPSGWRTSTTGYSRLQDELRNVIGDRIFFGAGSAELGSRARALIAAQAEWLRRRPDVVVTIEGHADDAVAGADDEAISARRAMAVRDRLLAEGVQADRIEVAPQGARDRIAVCADSDCAAQNRRAVLQVGVRRSQDPGIRPPLAPASRPLGRLPELKR